MSVFAIYDIAGRILQVEDRPPLAFDPPPPPRPWLPSAAGEAELEGMPASARDIPAWCEAHYVTASRVQPRPELPAWDKTTIDADGSDTATLAGLPGGAEARVDDGPWQAVQNNTVTFSASIPDTYLVEVRCWPWLTRSQEIVAE